MVQKVNGRVFAGDFLGANLDYYTVTTTVNIAPSDASSIGGDANSQKALDKLVEVIALRGQPILLGGVARSGSAGSYSYTLKFAIEHEGSWAVAAPAFAAEVGRHGVDFGFSSSNTSVVIASTI